MDKGKCRTCVYDQLDAMDEPCLSCILGYIGYQDGAFTKYVPSESGLSSEHLTMNEKHCRTCQNSQTSSLEESHKTCIERPG